MSPATTFCTRYVQMFKQTELHKYECHLIVINQNSEDVRVQLSTREPIIRRVNNKLTY